MDAYKVWSMSCDKRQSDYRVEYEARVAAESYDEALRMVMGQYEQETREPLCSTTNWMAVKLP